MCDRDESISCPVEKREEIAPALVLLPSVERDEDGGEQRRADDLHAQVVSG